MHICMYIYMYNKNVRYRQGYQAAILSRPFHEYSRLLFRAAFHKYIRIPIQFIPPVYQAQDRQMQTSDKQIYRGDRGQIDCLVRYRLTELQIINCLVFMVNRLTLSLGFRQVDRLQIDRYIDRQIKIDRQIDR